MAGIYLNHDLSFEERRRLVFEGELLLYTRTASTCALADHAIAMAVEAFAPLDPQSAQDHIDVAEFVRLVGPLKTRFTNDRRTK